MSDNSHIQWTDATWPITTGCTEAGPECLHCYARRDSWRLAHNPNPKVATAYLGVTAKTTGERVSWTGTIKCLPERLDWPLKWKQPRRIFVANMSDLFHPDVPDEFVDQVFAIMALCPQHTFQVLTKRSERMLEYILQRPYSAIYAQIMQWGEYRHLNLTRYPVVDALPIYQHWPLPNVSLGVSIGTQKAANERMPHIAELTKYAYSRITTFVSAEPLLESIHFRFDRYPVKWLILGGESGVSSRPLLLDWVKDGLDEAKAYGVNRFIKQLGTAWAKESGTYNLDSKGGNPEVWPQDLRIREFPHEGDRTSSMS